MNRSITLAAALLTACGATYPVPAQQLADTQSAQRSAEEVGAKTNPTAQLHLQLAREQVAKANALMKEDENRRADFMLLRAKADAELALALAHEQRSKLAAEQAAEKAQAQTKTNTLQGAPR